MPEHNQASRDGNGNREDVVRKLQSAKPHSMVETHLGNLDVSLASFW